MLYALPDHKVMEELLPAIRDSHLPVETALERLRRQPGLVPVGVNPQGKGSIYFADIGDTPLLEWKYIYTIERLAREDAIKDAFSTDLALLECENLINDGMQPHGLIFHVSRCGSTLMTKALGRCQNHLIINQGGPLQEGFWAAMTNDWQQPLKISPRNIGMFRNLVCLMTRKRRPEYRYCFVKFISWNIIYLDFIRAAFPDAAALYLYRDPVEVIATVLQETTAVLRAKGRLQSTQLTGLSVNATAGMSDVEFLAHCFAHYFKIAKKGADANALSLLSYQQLKNVEVFEDILSRGLKLHADGANLALMKQQYRYFSKDDSDSVVFTGDQETMLEILPQRDQNLIRSVCNEGIAKLDGSARNLFPTP